MSYENSFKLSCYKNEQLRANVVCPQCNIVIEQSFCGKCGTEGRIKDLPVDFIEVIGKFRKESDDAYVFIDNNGKTNESGSGYTIMEDLKEFSKKYPNIVFQLDVTWDSGFGDPPSRYFYENGKVQDCKVEMVFEDYNNSKMK